MHILLLAIALFAGDAQDSVTPIEQACNSGIVASCRDLGLMYANGRGVTKDDGRAVAVDAARARTLYEGACHDSVINGCLNLALMYSAGRGVPKDDTLAFTLYQKSCTGHNPIACRLLGAAYLAGRGTPEDDAQAVAMFQQACNARDGLSCTSLGTLHAGGIGVAKDGSRALALYQRGCAAGDTNGCTKMRGAMAGASPGTPGVGAGTAPTRPSTPPTTKVSSGTAFAIGPTSLLTAYHVVADSSQAAIRCPGNDRTIRVTVGAKAQAVDLAVLQVAAGTTLADYLPLALDTNAVLGERVFTVGYPAPSLLGVEPKFTEGSVSSLTGLKGDASILQISVPVQPGNSGGALINERGEVVGVVVSAAFLKDTGTLPQNINWAVKIGAVPLLLPAGTRLPPASAHVVADRAHVIAKATAASCLVVSGLQAPASSEPAVHLQGDAAPKKIKDVRPVYPASARAHGTQGVVTLQISIDKAGVVKDVTVLTSVPELDQAAIDAARQWRFTPTSVNGKAVEVVLTTTVHFSIK